MTSPSLSLTTTNNTPIIIIPIKHGVTNGPCALHTTKGCIIISHRINWLSDLNLRPSIANAQQSHGQHGPDDPKPAHDSTLSGLYVSLPISNKCYSLLLF